MKRLKNSLSRGLLLLLALLTLLAFAGCGIITDGSTQTETSEVTSERAETTVPVTAASDTEAQTTEPDSLSAFSLDAIPAFKGTPYAVLSNLPLFTEEEITAESFEYYPELDRLGRCGACVACLGVDLMPTEERGDISRVHPSGWVQATYDFVDGNALYNRSHLIGFQLAGENDNERNLITGTRYFNATAMLPFENMVADYLKETENHVMYRVTPLYNGDEPVARGVVMEAYSVEDQGEGICFCVYCYNVQPGVIIDYATGESRQEGESPTEQSGTYILNTSSRKFHKTDCSAVDSMNPENRQEYIGTREDLIALGYKPCGSCNP